MNFRNNDEILVYVMEVTVLTFYRIRIFHKIYLMTNNWVLISTSTQLIFFWVYRDIILKKKEKK